MSKKPTPVRTSRREFLKSAAVVGGAAALAIVDKADAADVKGEEEKVLSPAQKSKGYRVTHHVQTYYEKARF